MTSQMTLVVKTNRYAEFAAAAPTLIDDALRELGQRMYEIAYALAPERTGALKASMGWDITSPGELIVAAGVLYAAFVEFGTRYTSAQPYMIPAFEQVAHTIVDLIREAFERFFK